MLFHSLTRKLMRRYLRQPRRFGQTALATPIILLSVLVIVPLASIQEKHSEAIKVQTTLVSVPVNVNDPQGSYIQ
jgi:ABC-type lipoprotein release transport system permease subunit